MADWSTIQPKIAAGRGKAAAVLGMPHDVYRITTGSNGDWIAAGNKLAAQVEIFWKAAKYVTGTQEGDTKRGFSVYELVQDFSEYKVGDVFVNADPTYQAGFVKTEFATTDLNAICLAANAPEHKSIGVSCNKLARIYRPAGAGPTPDGYWEPTTENSTPFRCVNGVFTEGTVGQSAAVVPMGLQPLSPGGDKAMANVPGMTRKSNFACYFPPLQGLILAENDRIIDNFNNRYSVLMAYRQDTKLAGNFLIVEKEQSG